MEGYASAKKYIGKKKYNYFSVTLYLFKDKYYQEIRDFYTSDIVICEASDDDVLVFSKYFSADYEQSLELFSQDADMLEFLDSLEDEEKNNYITQFYVNFQESIIEYACGNYKEESKNLPQIGGGLDNGFYELYCDDSCFEESLKLLGEKAVEV